MDDHRFTGPAGDDTVIKMKSIVIYYSQTGNTKAIAKAIREGIGEVMPCDLARLRLLIRPERNDPEADDLAVDGLEYSVHSRSHLPRNNTPKDSGQRGVVLLAVFQHFRERHLRAEHRQGELCIGERGCHQLICLELPRAPGRPAGRRRVRWR